MPGGMGGTALLRGWQGSSCARCEAGGRRPALADLARLLTPLPLCPLCCRVRRHRTAVTVCSVLYADASPALRTPERAAQALTLGAMGRTHCYALLFTASAARVLERGQTELAARPSPCWAPRSA